MKVKDLIAVLQAADPDKQVLMTMKDSYGTTTDDANIFVMVEAKAVHIANEPWETQDGGQ